MVSTSILVSILIFSIIMIAIIGGTAYYYSARSSSSQDVVSQPPLQPDDGVADSVVQGDTSTNDEPSAPDPSPAPEMISYCISTFWKAANNTQSPDVASLPNIVRSFISQNTSSCSPNTQAGYGWGPSQLFKAYAEEVPDSDKYCVGHSDTPFKRAILAPGDDCNKQGFTKSFNFWLPKDRTKSHCVGYASHDGTDKYIVKKGTGSSTCGTNGWSFVFDF